MNEQVPDRAHEAVTLKFPLRRGSDTIEVVYVKKPRGKEMRLLPASVNGKGSTVGDLHPFAAKLAGLTLEEFESLELEDYTRVLEKVTGWMSEFPQSGPSGSPSSDASSTSGETSSSS